MIDHHATYSNSVNTMAYVNSTTGMSKHTAIGTYTVVKSPIIAQARIAVDVNCDVCIMPHN